jgi:broad specificity phosphatase PhoE
MSESSPGFFRRLFRRLWRFIDVSRRITLNLVFVALVALLVAALVERHGGQTIVVVTHGGVLDVVYRRVHGLPPQAPRDYPIPNAGINWLSIAGEAWSIDSWGEVAHLAHLA